MPRARALPRGRSASAVACSSEPRVTSYCTGRQRSWRCGCGWSRCVRAFAGAKRPQPRLFHIRTPWGIGSLAAHRCVRRLFGSDTIPMVRLAGVRRSAAIHNGCTGPRNAGSPDRHFAENGRRRLFCGVTDFRGGISGDCNRSTAGTIATFTACIQQSLEGAVTRLWFCAPGAGRDCAPEAPGWRGCPAPRLHR